MVPMMRNASATDTSPFTEAGFRALAERALHGRAPASPAGSESGHAAPPSDFDLNPELFPALAAEPEPRAAAVLVPVVARSRLTVLLTLRTDSLPSHAGQIAFPGGKMEPGETDPLTTALREAHEEIGLATGFVEPLGYLDAYRTGTGFRIYPVVALVRDGFALTLDTSEVAEAFEVPLDFLMDAENHSTHVRAWRGGERRFYAMPFEQRYIWGATAGIIRNMHQRLFAP
jgi:8-oxo-dGTP pyrophosphatase MutT (NUDIX family)